ncbi:MAG: hypothetical protein ACLGH3_01590 [Actinomycetota bacterium]
MPRGRDIDPSTLSPSERIVALAAWLGVLNGLIPWWFQAATERGTVRYNAGLTFGGVTTFVVLAAAGLIVLFRAWIWPRPAPRKDGAIYILLGLAALVALSVLNRTVENAWIGYWVGVADAGVLTVAGFARRRERLRGWQ